MSETRVKDLGATASTVADDDYIVIDGDTNGTRKYLLKTMTDQIAAVNTDITELETAINSCVTCADADSDGNVVITLVSV